MAANLPIHLRRSLQLRAWELMTEGRKQAEIAADLSRLHPDVSVTQSTVSRWISAQSRRIVARLDDVASTAFAAALAHYDRLIAEAWLAWERSKAPKKSATSSTAGDKRTTRTTLAEREGNPAWMAELRALIAAKCQLLSLQARFAPPPPDAAPKGGVSLLDVIGGSEAIEQEYYPAPESAAPAPPPEPPADATDPN